MIGKRIRKADMLAQKRFKYYHPEGEFTKQWGSHYRSTGTPCSCQMCRNPRHSIFYNEETKLTIQERKAPTITEEWY